MRAVGRQLRQTSEVIPAEISQNLLASGEHPTRRLSAPTPHLPTSHPENVTVHRGKQRRPCVRVDVAKFRMQNYSSIASPRLTRGLLTSERAD